MAKVNLLDLTNSPITEFIPKDHVKRILTELGFNPVSLVDGTLAGIAHKHELKHVIYNETDVKYLNDTIRYKGKQSSIEIVDNTFEEEVITVKFLPFNANDPLHARVFERAKTRGGLYVDLMGGKYFYILQSSVNEELVYTFAYNRATSIKGLYPIDEFAGSHNLVINFQDYQVNKYLIEMLMLGKIKYEQVEWVL